MTTATGLPECIDCHREQYPGELDPDGVCRHCLEGNHEPETDDIADGIVGGAAAHVYVTRCADCDLPMELSEPDEDGIRTWEVNRE